MAPTVVGVRLFPTVLVAAFGLAGISLGYTAAGKAGGGIPGLRSCGPIAVRGARLELKVKGILGVLPFTREEELRRFASRLLLALPLGRDGCVVLR